MENFIAAFLKILTLGCAAPHAANASIFNTDKICEEYNSTDYDISSYKDGQRGVGLEFGLVRSFSVALR